MNKKKLLIILGGVLVLLVVAAVVVFFLLRGRGEDTAEDSTEEPTEVVLPVVPAPITYALAELDSVVALPVGDSIIVSEEKPEETDVEDNTEEEEDSESSEEPSESNEGDETDSETEAEEETEEATDPVTVHVTYHYEGLAEPLERIALYCELLTEEDIGFVPVDEARMETELPAFEGRTGSVHLVRPIVLAEGAEDAEAALFSLQIGWEADKCSVTVARIAGSIVLPPPEPQPQPLSLTGAVDYFYSCTPAELGLSGTSMADYQVLPMDGAVLVGTTPCLRMNVYASDPETGTNAIAGQYLLSNDGLSLYFIDMEGNLLELER